MSWKRNTITGAGFALALVAFALGRASAQEGEETGGGGMPMPEWTKSTQQHEELLASCGSFDVAGEMWMVPGQPAQEFQATAVREPILGGKIVRETFRMDWGGMQMEGMLLQGYDTVRQKHFSIWMDSGSPVASVQYGAQAEDGSIVTWAEDPDWMTGKLKKTKTMSRMREDGCAETTIYDLKPDGSEAMTMRMVYTRADG